MYLFLAFNTDPHKGLNIWTMKYLKPGNIIGKTCLISPDVFWDKVFVLKYSENDQNIELIILEAVEQCFGGRWTHTNPITEIKPPTEVQFLQVWNTYWKGQDIKHLNRFIFQLLT